MELITLPPLWNAYTAIICYEIVQHWPDRLVVWQHAAVSHSNTTLHFFSTSSDHMPSPPHQIALNIGKNIKHGLYDGSPANQGTAALSPA
jgi:hypothetical protein